MASRGLVVLQLQVGTGRAASKSGPPNTMAMKRIQSFAGALDQTEGLRYTGCSRSAGSAVRQHLLDLKHGSDN